MRAFLICLLGWRLGSIWGHAMAGSASARRLVSADGSPCRQRRLLNCPVNSLKATRAVRPVHERRRSIELRSRPEFGNRTSSHRARRDGAGLGHFPLSPAGCAAGSVQATVFTLWFLWLPGIFGSIRDADADKQRRAFRQQAIGGVGAPAMAAQAGVQPQSLSLPDQRRGQYPAAIVRRTEHIGRC